MDFLRVDPLVKSDLVERLVRSWDLTPSASGECPKVIEEQVAIIKVKMCTSLLFFLCFFPLSRSPFVLVRLLTGLHPGTESSEAAPSTGLLSERICGL